MNDIDIDENGDDEYVKNNEDSENNKEVGDSEGTGGDQSDKNDYDARDNEDSLKRVLRIMRALFCLCFQSHFSDHSTYSVSTEVHFSDTKFLAVSSLLL